MTEETDIQNKRIFIGHLYELSEEYMTQFFAELTRAKRKDPKIWSVPANYFKQETFYLDYEIEGVHSKVAAKYSLCDFRPTKSGLILIIDEIKTGSRMTIYRTFMNGEDRYFTETQLKYAKEIR